MTRAPGSSATHAALVDLPRDRAPDVESARGSRTWSLRGGNFAVAITELVTGDRLEEIDVPDEHVIIVDGDVPITVDHAAAGTVPVAGPALVVVPAGTCSVQAASSTTMTRVFSARYETAVGRAVNHGDAADPAVCSLAQAAPVHGGRVVVHRMDELAPEEGRLGRIFRTGSLMVNWFPPQTGPRDTEALSPHSHDDFEQMSVTLEGRYVHHFRTPWTSRMSEWRDDQQVEVDSPSLALIPPRLVHTTRAIGPERHTLIDVFAPPRADFLARGWVLNADDYR